MIQGIRVLLIIFMIGVLNISQLAAHTVDCCETETHSTSSQDHHANQDHSHSSCGHCSFSLPPNDVSVMPHFISQEFTEFKSCHFPDPELRKPLQPPRA